MYTFLYSVNIACGRPEERFLLTGLHAVADIYCSSCKTTLGWKYVSQMGKQPSTVLMPCSHSITCLCVGGGIWSQSKVQRRKVHYWAGTHGQGKWMELIVLWYVCSLITLQSPHMQLVYTCSLSVSICVFIHQCFQYNYCSTYHVQ